MWYISPCMLARRRTATTASIPRQAARLLAVGPLPGTDVRCCDGRFRGRLIAAGGDPRGTFGVKRRSSNSVAARPPSKSRARGGGGGGGGAGRHIRGSAVMSTVAVKLPTSRLQKDAATIQQHLIELKEQGRPHRRTATMLAAPVHEARQSDGGFVKSLHNDSGRDIRSWGWRAALGGGRDERVVFDETEEEEEHEERSGTSLAMMLPSPSPHPQAQAPTAVSKVDPGFRVPSKPPTKGMRRQRRILRPPGQPPARGTGPEARSGRTERKPSETLDTATKALIAVNFMVFMVQMHDPSITGRFCQLAYAITDLGEWYRLATPIVLHGNFFHLLGNSIALYNVGPQTETLMGTKKFLALYVCSGVTGNILSCIVHPMSPSLGASGAIFGVLGAQAVLYLTRPLTSSVPPHQLFFTSIAQTGFYALVVGLMIPNIDHMGHLGGFLGGAAMATVMESARNKRRSR